MSVLSLYELHYGVALKKKEAGEQLAAQTLLVIEEIKKQFEILPLSGKEASTFGEIKALYKVRAKKKDKNQVTIKKHDVDFILAAAAIEYGLVIISNDGIFSKIKESFPKLKVENWAKV